MKILLITVLLLCFVSASYAQATYTAASCSENDVLTGAGSAYNVEQASKADGDIIAVPACAAGLAIAWTTSVSTSPTNSLTFKFAGSQSIVGGNDVSVIFDNVSHTPTDNAMWTLVAATGKVIQILGVTFKTNGGSTQSFNGSIRLFGLGQFRLGYDHFAMTVDGKQMLVSGCVYGVMDHSIMDLPAGSTENGVFIDQSACGSASNGNAAWNSASGLGTANSFYFEDDIFNGGTNGVNNVVPFANDCSGGGRFVFRHNTLNDVELQGHATGHSNNPPDRSCRTYEIYLNTFGSINSTAGIPSSAGFFNTGGTGVIWGNTITGHVQKFIAGREDRANNSTYPQTAPPAGWGYCGTAQTGSASNWDGNIDSSGWPCLDQIGRGQGDLLQGSFPTVCNATSTDCTNSIFTGRWPHQKLEPVYEWLDATSGSGTMPAVWTNSETQVSQNRDYYLGQAAGCSGTQTTGVCSGTVASRAANCTAGQGGTFGSSPTGSYGVAFWETDTQQLDVCTATNTWTNAVYKPFTYPYPLVGATAPIISFSPQPLAFGQAPVGMTSNFLTLTITNSGTANLTVSSLNSPGAFPFESGGTCSATPFTLAPGSSCTELVAFQPGSTGPFSQTNTTTDNTSTSPSPIVVTGNGTGPPAPVSTIFARIQLYKGGIWK